MDNTQKLTLARVMLAEKDPALGFLSGFLKDTIADNLHLSKPQNHTCDGTTVKWDAKYLQLANPQTVSEQLRRYTAHCALQHHLRLPLHNIKKGEIAQLAASMAVDAMFDGKNISAEEIYMELIRPPAPQDGDESTDGDDGKPTNAPTPHRSHEHLAPGDPTAPDAPDWQEALASVGALGSITGGSGTAETIAAITAPPIDWRAALRDFAALTNSPRNDWTRPDRRTLPGIISPRKSRRIGTLLVARDTSGSMSKKMLEIVNSAISTLSETGLCEILLVDFDNRIRAEQSLAPGQEAPAEVKGRCGTVFQPVFDRAEELAVQGIIVLSDMENGDPECCTTIPALYLQVSWYKTPQPAPQKAPGQVIVI